MVITGIGSRGISRSTYKSLTAIGKRLADAGWILRSGGADGSDSAWEDAWLGTGRMEIYLPWAGFNGRPKNDACYLTPEHDSIWFDAENVAKGLHPRFESLSRGAQALHTRNVYQVLGNDLNSPSDVVVATAPPKGMSVTGGTATAFNLARARGIPTFNLLVPADRQAFFRFVSQNLGGDYDPAPAIRSAEHHTCDLTQFMD